jgi:hypothetical protein
MDALIPVGRMRLGGHPRPIAASARERREDGGGRPQDGPGRTERANLAL